MDNIFVDGIEYRKFGNYLVSEDGTFLHNFKPYTPSTRPDGYMCIRHDLAHRIVAKLWVPNPRSVKYVHHKDENKTNNRADNLEWLTAKEHIAERHKDIIGKQPCPAEAKEKLRKFRTGQKHSEETKRKITEGLHRVDWASKNLKGRPGRVKTPEEIAKIMAAKVQPLMIEGFRFESMVQAEQWLGIKRGTIRRRCLSKNFPNYYWLPREYVKPPRKW